MGNVVELNTFRKPITGADDRGSRAVAALASAHDLVEAIYQRVNEACTYVATIDPKRAEPLVACLFDLSAITEAHAETLSALCAQPESGESA